MRMIDICFGSNINIKYKQKQEHEFITINSTSPQAR